MALPILCRIPCYGVSGGLLLRPLRISDAPSLFTSLRDETVLNALGFSGPSSSPFSAWWCFRRSHLLCYCIEEDSRRIGVMGLSSLVPGLSAELSLVIFPPYQGMGYGSRAVELITTLMKKHRSLCRLTVSVRRDNAGSVSFWEKAGFREEVQETGDIMRMTLNLQEAR